MSQQDELTIRILHIVNTVLFIIGTVIMAISLGAQILGLDITPGFGVVQMAQLLIGLTLVALAGFLQIYALRGADTPRSLQADVGLRLGATGLVLAYVSGFSDLIGIGTHVEPSFERPFAGPLQLMGIGVAIFLITIGMVLYYTSRGTRTVSSLNFLLDTSGKENG